MPRRTFLVPIGLKKCVNVAHESLRDRNLNVFEMIFIQDLV